MSDSDMDIDDEEVAVQGKHTIAGQSQLLNTPIQASDSKNDVKRHSVTGKFESSPLLNSHVPGKLTTPSKDSCGIFENIEKDKGTTGNSQPNNISGNSGNNIKLENGKGTTLSRFPAPGITPNSFPSGNEPEQKRAALLCKYFAKGWCFKGTSCRFLHVNESSNSTSQQQTGINMAGSSAIQSVEERRILDSKEGVRVSLLNEYGVTSLHTREGISLVNPPGPQRVFPFMSSSENMRRESLIQKYGVDVTDNRSLVINNSNSFTLRSSFVHEHGPLISSYKKTDLGSSGPAWTGSLFSSIPANEYASNLGNFQNGNNIYGSGSLPTLQAVSVSSDKDAEGKTTSNSKKASSNDWEPSEPFKASFTIPPYILPSSDALYDPFMDIENPEDRSLNAPLSSKGKDARKQKDGDSSSGLQARESNNDDKNSSCSQNQRQDTVARKNLEAHGVVEGVATSVVDQNDTTPPPSKEVSSSAAAENRVVLKRSNPAGHDSWHRSDGSSYKKVLKSDEVDGEVRSDAGMKVMRQFRTAVVDTIKEMLKPLWREGRFNKDVHNMIVKRATEKVVSTAVQYHQVPTDTESVEQYIGSSAPKIVKLVEGYVEKYRNPKV